MGNELDREMIEKVSITILIFTECSAKSSGKTFCSRMENPRERFQRCTRRDTGTLLYRYLLFFSILFQDFVPSELLDDMQRKQTMRRKNERETPLEEFLGESKPISPSAEKYEEPEENNAADKDLLQWLNSLKTINLETKYYEKGPSFVIFLISSSTKSSGER
jgi:hypothetical protein